MTEPIVRLPRRQLQIATLVATGLTNKEIAAALGISVHTVRNTLRIVFEKLAVQNRVELANTLARGAVAGDVERQA